MIYRKEDPTFVKNTSQASIPIGISASVGNSSKY